MVSSGDYKIAADSRSDAFFFDFDGIKNLFDTSANRNFTAPHLGGKSPWTGVDSNTTANVFSMAVELPTAEPAPRPELRIWGRCSVLRDGELVHADRAGHPSMSSLFNTDDTKVEYNAGEPVNDRERWTDQFVHLLGHTGGRDTVMTVRGRGGDTAGRQWVWGSAAEVPSVRRSPAVTGPPDRKVR